MKQKKKHYVIFLYNRYAHFPSSLNIEESKPIEVSSRDVEKITLPTDESFALQFFDQIDFKIKVTTEERGQEEIVISGSRFNFSPRYYFGGEIMTRAEVKKKEPNYHSIIYFMDRDKISHMIKCRTGRYEPFKKNDLMIEQDIPFGD